MKTLLLLLLACVGAARAAEVVIDAKDLPREFHFQAPSAGYIKLEFTATPKDLHPLLGCAEPKLAALSADHCEARVPAGDLKLTLSNQWNSPLTGEIRFNVIFTAETDASETNDDFDHARSVPVGKPVELAIMPIGDQDVLALDITEPGYLVAKFEDMPDGHKDAHAHFAYGPGRDIGMDLTRVDWPGRVFATVNVEWNGWSSTKPFHVTFTLIPELDPFEPNDDPRDAQPLEMGVWHQAVLAPRDDIDWFRVHFDEPSYLICESAGEGVERNWALFDAAGKQQVCAGATLQAGPGDWLLRLSSAWGNPDLRPFRFRVRQIIDPDELAPDGTTPAKVEFGHVYTVALMRADEQDHYQIDIPGPGYLSAHFGAVHQDVLVNLERAGEPPIRIDASPARVAAGKVAVTLSSGWGHVVPAPFHLSFVFTPSADSEVAHDPAHARPLALGESGVVRLGPCARDVNWFRVQVPADGTMYIITSNDPGVPGSTPEVALTDGDGKQVLATFSQNTNDPQRARPVKAGSWLVRVAGDAQPDFHISAWLVPTGDLVMRPHPSGLDLALVGLDADAGTMAALRVLAGSAGGSFGNTTEAAGLEREFAAAVGAAKREAEHPAQTNHGAAGGRRVLWILASLAGLIVVLLLGRRFPRKDQK